MTAEDQPRAPIIGLCYGGAEGTYEEGYRAELMLREAGAQVVYLACNEAGIRLPTLHHWGTLHPAKMPLWRDARRGLGLPETYVSWSIARAVGVDRTVRTWRGGSSGLHIVDVALNPLNLDAAICCGIPLDDRKNQFRGLPWGGHAPFRAGWQKGDILAVLRRRCRSMSGWTRELLGAPSAEWVAGVHRRPA